MQRCLIVLALAALAGCAAPSSNYVRAPDPCMQGEATNLCQIERYSNVNAP